MFEQMYFSTPTSELMEVVEERLEDIELQDLMDSIDFNQSSSELDDMLETELFPDPICAQQQQQLPPSTIETQIEYKPIYFPILPKLSSIYETPLYPFRLPSIIHSMHELEKMNIDFSFPVDQQQVHAQSFLFCDMGARY